MNPRRSHPGRQSGNAIIAALIFMIVGLILSTAYIKISTNDARLTRQAMDLQRAQIAAEAGVDYGVQKLKELILYYQLNTSYTEEYIQTLIDAIPQPPTFGDGSYKYVTRDGASAFRITMECMPTNAIIQQGASCRGLQGTYQYFTVACGAINTNSGESAVVKQRVQAVGVCLLRFGVFYEQDLEVLPGGKMIFDGPVHANGNLYLGGDLTFRKNLTAHGDIFNRRKDTGARFDGVTITNLTPINAAAAMQSMKNGTSYYDSDNSNWMAAAIQRWGGAVLSESHGVADLTPPVAPDDDPHVIVERPTATNDPAYDIRTENEKFYNKAGIRIIVSNGVFTAYDWTNGNISSLFSNVCLSTNSLGRPKKASGTNSADYTVAPSNYLMAATNPAYGVYDTTVTNFWDGRQARYTKPVDIYMDRLFVSLTNQLKNLTNNNIIYISQVNTTTNTLPCVRIRNGAVFPSGATGLTNTTFGADNPAASGLSIVSDLPVYVEGNFNVRTDKGTTNTDIRPVMIAGDATTMLSSSWEDRLSKSNLTTRVPVATTVRAVLMTGNTTTIAGGGSSKYNGGLENVIRYLENWTSSKTNFFYGSIVDLWASRTATNAWTAATSYYGVPTRQWGYDTRYSDANFLPPGLTKIYGMEELYWEMSTYEREGW